MGNKYHNPDSIIRKLNNNKIVVTHKFIGDYTAWIDIFYSDNGKNYCTTAITKELEILNDEVQFKQFIYSVVLSQRERRAS